MARRVNDMPITRPDFGRLVLRARTQSGMTQVRLAERADISRSYLCDIEKCRGQSPSIGTVSRIAKALGLPIAMFTVLPEDTTTGTSALDELIRLKATMADAQRSIQALESILMWSQ